MTRVETIGACTLYLGDCRDILPTLTGVDALITDPPYGINADKGFSSGGRGFDGKPVFRKTYEGSWDAERPDPELFRLMLAAAPLHIIWGGNYFSDLLPVSRKWLWWDKLQTMPTYSDGELAWTSLPGTSTKKFIYNGSGIFAEEKDREHPTQKPVALMNWCLGLVPKAAVICDPFMGSGTTGVSCAELNRSFIGIERDPTFYDVARRRIEQAYLVPPILAETKHRVTQVSLLDDAA